MIRTETFKSLIHRAITAYVCDIYSEWENHIYCYSNSYMQEDRQSIIKSVPQLIYCKAGMQAK